jgi:hypothetical protein
MNLQRGLACLLALGTALAPVGAWQTANPPPVTPAATQFFEMKIRPLLSEHCFRCHGEKKHKGSLRLDSRSAMLTGGDSGPAMVPGHPEKSLLLKAIGYEDQELKMPPPGKLTKEQIADLTQWIKAGAPWPGEDKGGTIVRKGEFQITDKDRAHWSFQPPKRPAVPAVKNAKWVANPIDSFILAKLEAKDLEPNPPASKLELVRRVFYDLTGLPPTPADVEAFLADNSPTAYENLIDRLLTSPHYGEKWARHWLDLVRYAETNSYERDNPKPNVWRYRDYVIGAFNKDMPYDLFIRQQIAGDELAPDDPEAIIATGYYRLGIWDDEPVDRLQAFYDGLDDIVATTGQVFLGLTVDCARCHNHKIDPIAQKDYYRLLAFFRNINHYKNGGPTDEKPLLVGAAKQAYEQRVAELQKQRDQIQADISTIEKEFRAAYMPEKKNSKADLAKLIVTEGPKLLGKDRIAEYQKLKKNLEKLKNQKVPAEMALCVTEPGPVVPDTFVLLRGNPNVKGDKVKPGFPFVFGVADPVIPEPKPGAKSSGQRLVLANWLASKDNAMTARVMINRIWQQHFGRGIVRSSNDFGFQGMRPTHPELLDWLASEFVDRGWRLKSMHKLIMMSNAYKMSTKANAKALAADPVNDLFWRFDMRRLTAEEIRDSILAVSGNLNLKMFGPAMYPEIPKEVLAGQSVPGRGWGKSSPQEQARRSIYIHVKRSLLYPILESFDLAEPDRTTPVRFSTTQPTQALLMLNSEFLNQQAAIFAQRVQKEAGKETGAQVRLALSLATQRVPNDAEIRRGVDLIQALQTEDGLSPDAALKCFCLVVLNLNEFIYLD